MNATKEKCVESISDLQGRYEFKMATNRCDPWQMSYFLYEILLLLVLR